MRILIIVTAIAAMVLSIASFATAGEEPAKKPAGTGYGKLYLDGFKDNKLDRFPRKWRTWPTQRDEASKPHPRLSTLGAEPSITFRDRR